LRPHESMRSFLLGRLASKQDLNAEDRRRLINTLYVKGDHDRLVRFWILFILSVLIAAFGLLADSTAVVIGAMLLAPLMTPIMGFAGGLVMSWPKRMAESFSLLLTASVVGVALGWLMADLSPITHLQVLPSEVVSRTSPGMLDLFIALAAGGAGAFATVREDVSASLPGVAIAVALVPPLTTIGIVIAVGTRQQYMGAMLLYVTNIVAIVLSASIVFLLTGFVPKRRVKKIKEQLGIGITITVFVLLLISMPLYNAVEAAVRQAQTSSAATKVVREWIGDAPIKIESIKAEEDGVNVTLVTLGEPPSVEDLADRFESNLGRPLDVNLIWFQGEEKSALRHEQSGESDGLTPIPGL
jgi:uncharacterized hydrophobic protein (TIGR00271 family)